MRSTCQNPVSTATRIDVVFVVFFVWGTSRGTNVSELRKPKLGAVFRPQFLVPPGGRERMGRSVVGCVFRRPQVSRCRFRRGSRIRPRMREKEREGSRISCAPFWAAKARSWAWRPSLVGCAIHRHQHGDARKLNPSPLAWATLSLETVILGIFGGAPAGLAHPTDFALTRLVKRIE